MSPEILEIVMWSLESILMTFEHGLGVCVDIFSNKCKTDEHLVLKK